MKIDSLDHIVLGVADVQRSRNFDHDVLELDAREERSGKWSLHFGKNKISLQDAATSPEIARDAVPGSGDFCLLTKTPISDVVSRLKSFGLELVAGPDERIGATGKILSVYFRDPDGNWVEVSNLL